MSNRNLMSAVMHKRHGNILMPSSVDVPFGWFGIVDRMLRKLADLPTDVRAFLIVQDVSMDRDGLLDVTIAALRDAMPRDGWELVEDIIADARNEAAWSCVKDHRPAWIVHPPSGGPRPLCPECQEYLGMPIRRAHA